VIQGIVDFPPERDVPLLGEMEILGERHVRIPEAGRTHGVMAQTHVASCWDAVCARHESDDRHHQKFPSPHAAHNGGTSWRLVSTAAVTLGRMILPLLLMAAAGLNAGSVSARAHLGSGNQLMQAERYAEAAEQFEQALRDDSAMSEARGQLAICYFELRDYARARPLFEQMAASRDSAHAAAYYLGRIDLIEHHFDSAIRRFGSIPRSHPVRDELYYLGSAFYKQEKYSQSAEILRQAAAENPRDSRIHQLLARACQKLGWGDRAEKEFAETRRLHDYYLEGSIAIGRCRSLLLEQKVDDAWALCRALTNTDDVDKLVAIGMLFGQAEQYPKAMEVWEEAAELDPDSAEIQYNLALTLFHLKDVRRARDNAAAAVRLRPDFVEANILYGTILYMGGEDREALAVLARAHELQPEDKTVDRLLAEELSIASADQDCKRAAESLKRAITLQPDLPAISPRLAQLKARCPAE
jgi:tetratricopeptide (TPR) repeat protein